MERTIGNERIKTMNYRSIHKVALAGLILSAIGLIAVADDAKKSTESKTETKVDFSPKSASAKALLATNPKTPEAIARVGLILAEMGEAGPARKLFGQLLKATPDEKTWVLLGERLSAAQFGALRSNPAVAPEGMQVAEAVLAAIEKSQRSPEKIQAWIGQLLDPNEDSRARAVAGLVQAGPAAVGPLLNVLADPQKSKIHPSASDVLDRIGLGALGPLVGALDSPSAQMRVEAIRTLSMMATDLGAKNRALFILGSYSSPAESPDVQKAARLALSHMIGREPTIEEARKVLVESSRNYLDSRATPMTDADSQVTVWGWDAKENRPTAARYTPDEGATRIALKLAGDALAIDPSDTKLRQLYLLALTKLIGQTIAWNEPLELKPGSLSAQASEFGVDELRAVLDEALKSKMTASAIATSRVLGRLGLEKAESILVASRPNEPSPLVRAVRAADRRLRFVACEAIMNLNPKKPFPGVSFVTESIVFLSGSSGIDRALVVGGTSATNNRIAGFLAEMKLKTDHSITGSSAMEKLTSSPDYILAYVDTTIGHPILPLFMQSLRGDGRSGPLGVGLVGLEEAPLVDARRIAADDTLSLVLPPPSDLDGARWQVEKLISLSMQGLVPADQRLVQAARALGWLGRIAEASGKVFPLRGVQEAASRALFLPQFSVAAVRVLADRPTDTAQVRLVEIASGGTLPIELRQAALSGFERHLEKNGILLTTDQILRQYDRYNASANQDRSTQQILSKILDRLENPQGKTNENKTKKQ
jgi:hypothetical protein